MFRQCSMDKKTKDGKKTVVSWIPEKYAIKGKYISLENRETGVCEDGWKVVLVGTVRLSADQVSKRSQDYKNQRKVSDI